MNPIIHKQQQEIWDKEHTTPQVLLQMDSSDPSSGVIKFWDWLKNRGETDKYLSGLEMGCGKGKSVIWLAVNGVNMLGFDFSPKAVEVAKLRAKEAGVQDKTKFYVQDATFTWDFLSNTFDFVIDCFATTDIESQEGREFAVSEMKRVVKPNGYIFVYVMSSDDEYHKEMIKKSPADEKNAFLHTTGKFEKVFDRAELLELYKDLEIVEEERVPKIATFSGKDYKCNHHWIVFRKTTDSK